MSERSSVVMENHTSNIRNTELKNYSDNNVDPVYSIDDAVNKAGFGKFQLRLLFLVGLGWASDAIEIMFLSIAGDLLACEWPLRRVQNALLTCVVFVGIMIGSPVFGILSDIYGRKKSLALSMSLLFVFSAVSAASPSYIWMLVFRCCMGFALGGAAQGFTLCSEYCPTDMRGKYGFYLAYFWSFGIVAVILMTWVIMIYLDNWKILVLIISLPSLFVVLSMNWYPESARFFLVSNQYDRAKRSLEKMALMNCKDLPPGNLVRVPECTKRGRLQDLLSRKYRKATFIFWYMWLAISFAYYGISLISPRIIQQGSLLLAETKENASMSFSDHMQSIIPCIKYTRGNYIDLLWISAAEFPGYVIYMFLIERFNRKYLLGTSCAISCILILFLLIETTYKIAILLFLFGARAIISASFFLVHLMILEAFPTTIRATALGSSSSFCRLGGIIVPFVAQVLVIHNPTATILLFTGVLFLAAIAACQLPLDTKGVHLEETHY